MSINFNAWDAATGDLSWGVQSALLDTLALVSEGQIELDHGADSLAGKPCLINAVANMIAHDVNQVSPMGWFPGVVSAFDDLNRQFVAAKINDGTGKVSELAAEILIQHFGARKPQPDLAEVAMQEAKAAVEAAAEAYIEPTDAEMQEYLKELAVKYDEVEAQNTNERVLDR